MTLKEHINTYSTERSVKSPRAKEIERIAKACHVTTVTVYRWIRNEVTIPENTAEKLQKVVKGLDL